MLPVSLRCIYFKEKVESLLKSEVISDDVRRLLLEIMFAGVNHSLISQVHAMLPALTVIVPDKKLQLVCLALFASALLPQVMLTRQMDYMQLTVGVDYLARISGAASQALNKLDNMA